MNSIDLYESRKLTLKEKKNIVTDLLVCESHSNFTISNPDMIPNYLWRSCKLPCFKENKTLLERVSRAREIIQD